MEVDSALVDLQTQLNLPLLPRVIECFDVSNLGQEHVVSGMVSFKNAKPDKKNYRRFKIKTFAGQDDFAAVNEVVSRRYRRLVEEKSPLARLGAHRRRTRPSERGKNSFTDAWTASSLDGLAKEHEEIYLPDESTPKIFDKNSRMMLLLRKIRDAAHDFSLGYNLKRTTNENQRRI